jgi:hypothetical protein
MLQISCFCAAAPPVFVFRSENPARSCELIAHTIVVQTHREIRSPEYSGNARLRQASGRFWCTSLIHRRKTLFSPKCAPGIPSPKKVIPESFRPLRAVQENCDKIPENRPENRFPNRFVFMARKNSFRAIKYGGETGF